MVQRYKEGDEGTIPINQRVIAQQSSATIKSLLEAIVELVTNSDDSYRRLEQNGVQVDGSIRVTVKRKRGGQCARLMVEDQAEGMSIDGLLAVLEFGADTSGFNQGQTIRGFLGKGLKESVFALGNGTIRTMHNGLASSVRLWKEGSEHRWRVEEAARPAAQANNTTVDITVENSQITSPRASTLADHISNHFALRDICQSNNRYVELVHEDVKTKSTKPLRFNAPDHSEVVRRTLQISSLGEAALTLWETSEPLDVSTANPHTLAGIVVKSETIPLDKRLFSPETEEATQYFFGEVEVPGIFAMLRSNDQGILDPSRSGLDWRNIKAQDLRVGIENAVRQEIDRKRDELEASKRTVVHTEHQRKLHDVCSLLNKLASSELDDIPGWGSNLPPIQSLLLKPEVGYSNPGEPRRFTVYLPRELADDSFRPVVNVSLHSKVGQVQSSHTQISLTAHSRRADVLTGHFDIVGQSEGDSCIIIAKYDDSETMAEFRARPLVERRTDISRERRSGLFRNFQFDDWTARPIQRVSFDAGQITVYLQFPPISKYIAPGGEHMDSPQGSLMLAELVAEAFSRYVARRRLDTGIVPFMPGSEIDAYNNEVNQLMHKYLRLIHSSLVQEG